MRLQVVEDDLVRGDTASTDVTKKPAVLAQGGFFSLVRVTPGGRHRQEGFA
ncbi:hypothetical protein [Zoogloea dura]|jgi:hypothetical protein|uniref:Uncharacterized protein n=1 Tax=Zoogloea dura TaxID=2728840 RepID=A0A848GCA8_9RHOO|nr:hypothetical protein [Zoogloea dura]NML28033.1 hypothetical protein [Zoogloea dura]